MIEIDEDIIESIRGEPTDNEYYTNNEINEKMIIELK